MTFLSIPSLVNKKILDLCCNCREWWGGIDGETFPVLAKTCFNGNCISPGKQDWGGIFALSSSGHKAQFNSQFFKARSLWQWSDFLCSSHLLWAQGFPGAWPHLPKGGTGSAVSQLLGTAASSSMVVNICCGTCCAHLSWSQHTGGGTKSPTGWTCCPSLRWSPVLTHWWGHGGWNALGNRSFPLGNVTGSVKEVMWCRSSQLPFVSSEPSKSAGPKQCDASCLINNPFSTSTGFSLRVRGKEERHVVLVCSEWLWLCCLFPCPPLVPLHAQCHSPAQKGSSL